MRWTALMVAALIWAAPAAADDERLEWPLRPRPNVARLFDAPSPNWNRGHRGVDLAGAPVSRCMRRPPARWSSPVSWPADRWYRSPIRAGCGPATSRSDQVRVGQRVATGTVLGELAAGHPGCAAQACLHWGAMWGPASHADYVDPLGLMASTPIRLKPLR